MQVVIDLHQDSSVSNWGLGLAVIIEELEPAGLNLELETAELNL